MSKPSISPSVWTPPGAPTPPPTGTLPQLHILPVPGEGPEDALFVGDAIVTGLNDGRIIKVSLDGWQIEVLAGTGGRPLGLEIHPDGIVVCDAEEGLLLLDEAGTLTTLIAKGEHDLRVCNNAAVAPDGTIYFTDSSQRFDLEHWTADIIEHSGTGRLLKRSPDGSVQVLAGGLQFANGVALTPEFVAVAQTGLYSVDRVWLNSGRHEPWITNLPAFPDNIATGDDGLVWVARPHWTRPPGAPSCARSSGPCRRCCIPSPTTWSGCALTTPVGSWCTSSAASTTSSSCARGCGRRTAGWRWAAWRRRHWRGSSCSASTQL